MECARLQSLDLLGFLENPRSAEYAAFREHYPTCRTCAAELRVWTELRESLAAAGGLHPRPEQLVRYEDGSQLLSAAERRSIEEHVAGCASCRDELRSLRAFVPEALPAPRSRVRARPPRRGLGRLRGVLWHPAFAYALVAALLIPFVAEWGGLRAPDPNQVLDPERALREDPPNAPQEAARSPALARAKVESVTEESPSATELKRALAPPAGRDALAPAGLAERPEGGEQPASARVPQGATAEADLALGGQGGRVEPGQASRPPGIAPAERELARAVLEPVNGSRAARPSKPDRSPSEPSEQLAYRALELDEGQSSPEPTRWRALIPLPPQIEPGTAIEVRLFDPSDGTERRDELRAPLASRTLVYELDDDWLASGRARLELRESGTTEPLALLSLQRPPSRPTP
jgi:hypothetical protein